MKAVVGIDLGSTTTKAILLDEEGEILGRGITNSRSNYEVACLVARQEAVTSARFELLRRVVGDAVDTGPLLNAFRLETYVVQLADLRQEVLGLLDQPHLQERRAEYRPPAERVLDEMHETAAELFLGGGGRRSDFFRDIAGAAYLEGAERASQEAGVSFERLAGLYDRAILDVETRPPAQGFADLLAKASERIGADQAVDQAVRDAVAVEIDEVAFVGTGYGRRTLPFPKQCVRSEILCHGRGAHRAFAGTRTALDIGGQDTKAIQVDANGVVTSFQMNDRCAAGCGRYLGYIADELNLGLHELGPLALQARKKVRVNSTCTVFAGAELRERLALGQSREDILAGLHRAIMLRAMSLLARSGGIRDEFTFTGGVCKNPMATKILRELVDEHYGEEITLNADPDSIYMGALGAAMFALDDHRGGRAGLLGSSVEAAA